MKQYYVNDGKSLKTNAGKKSAGTIASEEKLRKEWGIYGEELTKLLACGFLVELEDLEPFIQPEPEKPKQPTYLTPWVINPEMLVSKDLESLNVMVVERDPSPTCPTFDTIEEAVAWLSQDYKG